MGIEEDITTSAQGAEHQPVHHMPNLADEAIAADERAVIHAILGDNNTLSQYVISNHGPAIREIGLSNTYRALIQVAHDAYYLILVHPQKIQAIEKVTPEESLQETAMRIVVTCFERDPELLDSAFLMGKGEMTVPGLRLWQKRLNKTFFAFCDENSPSSIETPEKGRKDRDRSGERRDTTTAISIPDFQPAVIDKHEVINQLAVVVQLPLTEVESILTKNRYLEALALPRTPSPTTITELLEKSRQMLGQNYCRNLFSRSRGIFYSNEEIIRFDNCFNELWYQISRMPEVEKASNGTTNGNERERRKAIEVNKVLAVWGQTVRKTSHDIQALETFVNIFIEVAELRREVATLEKPDLLLPSDPYTRPTLYSSIAELKTLRDSTAKVYQENSNHIERTPLTHYGIDKVWIFGAYLDSSIRHDLRSAFPEIAVKNWKFQEHHWLNPSDIPKPQQGVLAVWIPLFGGHTELELLQQIRETPNSHFTKISGRNATILENKMRSFIRSTEQ